MISQLDSISFKLLIRKHKNLSRTELTRAYLGYIFIPYSNPLYFKSKFNLTQRKHLLLFRLLKYHLKIE